MNSIEQTPVIIETPSGKLEGLQRGRVAAFKGIPFAKAKRWQAPERVAAWAGVRTALRSGDIAPQNPTPLQGLMGASGGTQSEDCLSLNVWTQGCDGAKRPVMVWIHGGAFTTGAGSLGLYTGKHLCEIGNVVVVTINYRLGSFGFLRLQDVSDGRIISSGSEGLADQVMALEWVRDNIASFGGHPGNVTIFGESAGAMSVVALMASAKAKGLFHKAIAQSGGGHFSHTKDHANRIADVFVRHAGIPIDRFCDAPADLLLKAQLDLLAEVDTKHDPHKIGAMAFQPVIDGDVLTSLPINAIRAGSAANVSLIAGTTREEWKLWTALDAKAHAMDEDWLSRWAVRMFGESASSLMAAHPDGTPYDRFVAMQTQRAFREPTLRLLDAQSSHAEVFDYRFDWRSPAVGGAFGACHAIELGFVFGSYSIKGPDNFFGQGDAADNLHKATAEAWTSFANTGQPAISQSIWPRWSESAPQMLVLGGDLGAFSTRTTQLEPAWAALHDTQIGV